MFLNWSNKLTFLILICFTPFLLAAQNLRVNFIVSLNADSIKRDVYIAGSLAQLGNWDPGKIKLKAMYGNNFQVAVNVPKGQKIEYKITSGSWEKEAVSLDCALKGNSVLRCWSDTTIRIQVYNWKDKCILKPKITGDAEFIKAFKANGLDNRDICIWLPPGYKQNVQERYPVLYIHDGQNAFDPNTSTLGVDWGLDEMADSLIKKAAVVPFIMVAINNSKDRSDEFSPGKKGDLYMDFICHQLKPFIDTKYRTIPDAKHTANLGSSSGGLIAFMLAWEHPEVIGMAACYSPSFKYESFDYVDMIKKKYKKHPDMKLYIQIGTEGLEEKLLPGVNKMISFLDAKSIPYTYYLDKGAEHNEIAWRNKTYQPLRLFFGK